MLGGRRVKPAPTCCGERDEVLDETACWHTLPSDTDGKREPSLPTRHLDTVLLLDRCRVTRTVAREVGS